MLIAVNSPGTPVRLSSVSSRAGMPDRMPSKSNDTATSLASSRLNARSDPDSGWLARLGGLVGALFLLFSDTFWISAVEAEVYGLAAFMMALLTWLGLVWYEHRTERSSDWILLLLIYLCGLGVGFHLGALLVYPAFFVLVWLAGDRQLPMLDLLLVSVGLALFLASTTFITDTRVLKTLTILFALGCVLRLAWPRLRPETASGAGQVRWRPFALIGLLLFVTGLSVHAVLMIRAGAVPEPAINQTVPEDFDTLMSVLRREQYPPLNPLERQAPLTVQFQYYYDFLLEQFSFLPQAGPALDRVSVLIGPLLLALLGLAHTLRRARPVAWFLLLSYLINAEGLTLYLNFTANEVRERDYFYFAAFMYAAMFIGLGTTALLRWTSGPLGATLDRLEAAALPPPPQRPFAPAGVLYQILAAFVLALVAMVVVPAATKLSWLGLYLFGSAFVGFWLAPRLARLAQPPDSKQAPATWAERPVVRQLGLAGGLAFAVLAAGWLLLQFAGPQDQVFVAAVYAGLCGGQFLFYGERRTELGGRPRPDRAGGPAGDRQLRSRPAHEVVHPRPQREPDRPRERLQHPGRPGPRRDHLHQRGQRHLPHLVPAGGGAFPARRDGGQPLAGQPAVVHQAAQAPRAAGGPVLHR